jgi:hypothetical protein
MDLVIAAALISTFGGGVLDIFGGIGEAEESGLDRDAQLEMAANRLGFDYAELKEKAAQYRQELTQRIREHADKMGLDWADLQESIRSAKAREKVETGTLELGKQKATTERVFGTSDRLREIGATKGTEAIKKGIRGAFKTGPVGRPTMAVKPGTSSPTKDIGAQALQANQPSSNINNNGRFPLTMGA